MLAQRRPREHGGQPPLHVEFKCIDGTANPYFFLGALLTAGMLNLRAEEPADVRPVQPAEILRDPGGGLITTVAQASAPPAPEEAEAQLLAILLGRPGAEQPPDVPAVQLAQPLRRPGGLGDGQRAA